MIDLERRILAAKREAAKDDWSYFDMSMPGQELVGIYRETREVRTDFGTRTIYVFTDLQTGKTINVPGTGHFEHLWAMKDIKPNDLVYIQYCGKLRSKDREFHRWQVALVARAGEYEVPTGERLDGWKGPDNSTAGDGATDNPIPF